MHARKREWDPVGQETLCNLYDAGTSSRGVGDGLEQQYSGHHCFRPMPDDRMCSAPLIEVLNNLVGLD